MAMRQSTVLVNNGNNNNVVLQQEQQPPPQHVPTGHTNDDVHNHNDNVNNNAPRSISLPDMTRYAARASAEENKRKKRLARNRASARLRRLKKKNLVDTYEGEVGVLETSLAKLRTHSWGQGHDHEALLEALSMDRGQQAIPPEARQDFIRDILKQQKEQVENIKDVHLEVLLLNWLANYETVHTDNNDPRPPESSSAEQQPSSSPDKDDADTVQLAEELNALLSLTPAQKEQLRATTQACHEERQAIETVDLCLDAMLNNEWIMNHPVEECTRDFMSVLNKGQMSKFLLWTDHNSEAIDQLDYVNASPAGAPPAQSPVFLFGTDSEQLDGGGGSGGGALPQQQGVGGGGGWNSGGSLSTSMNMHDDTMMMNEVLINTHQ